MRPLITLVCAALVTVSMAVPSAAPGAEDPSQPADVLVSRQLAAQANLRVGDIIMLSEDQNGSRPRRFRVAGVYEPTPDPMRFAAKRLEVRLHLPDLISLTADPSDPASTESVSALNLALLDADDASAVSSTIAARMPGLVVRPATRSTDEGEVFSVIDRFHRAIAIVTLLGSTAFLLALMVIRAEERRDIIGILRLVGISARSVFTEVLFEGLFIAIAGALLGVGIALLGEGLVNRFFQWRYDTNLIFVRVTSRIVFESVALAIPLGIAAGLAASWPLFRRDVVSLIRR
jgi:ABC-type lipoprotein release transport system permease subunit